MRMARLPDVMARRRTQPGKDTPSGHWEMMGLPVDYDWGYFPRTVPTFPKALTDALIRVPGCPAFSAIATPRAP